MNDSSQYSSSDKGSSGGRRSEGRGREGRDGEVRVRRGGGGRIPVDAVIDYKNPQFLKQFISDRGKILPSRLSGANPKQQRKLATAIKRARAIALLPFAAQ